MIGRGKAALVCAGLMLGAGTAAQAQQLVYSPINPMFGGNPGNASQLESDANTQNPFKAKPSNANLTQSQLFAQQLQSQLLADLANQVSQAIFGPNAQPSGTFAFGGETVTFTRSLGEITVTITDPTGAQTTIQLPTSAASSGAN